MISGKRQGNIPLRMASSYKYFVIILVLSRNSIKSMRWIGELIIDEFRKQFCLIMPFRSPVVTLTRCFSGQFCDRNIINMIILGIPRKTSQRGSSFIIFLTIYEIITVLRCTRREVRDYGDRRRRIWSLFLDIVPCILYENNWTLKCTLRHLFFAPRCRT